MLLTLRPTSSSSTASSPKASTLSPGAARSLALWSVSFRTPARRSSPRASRPWSSWSRCATWGSAYGQGLPHRTAGAGGRDTQISRLSPARVRRPPRYSAAPGCASVATPRQAASPGRCRVGGGAAGNGAAPALRRPGSADPAPISPILRRSGRREPRAPPAPVRPASLLSKGTCSMPGPSGRVAPPRWARDPAGVPVLPIRIARQCDRGSTPVGERLLPRLRLLQERALLRRTRSRAARCWSSAGRGRRRGAIFTCATITVSGVRSRSEKVEIVSVMGSRSLPAGFMADLAWMSTFGCGGEARPGW
jgi:hypothetical protein